MRACSRACSLRSLRPYISFKTARAVVHFLALMMRYLRHSVHYLEIVTSLNLLIRILQSGCHTSTGSIGLYRRL